MTNVLIVDDERNIRKAFLADIASAADRYRVADAIPNAEGALPLCAAQKVDLILMDINTADYENGIEVSARIKQSYPYIKIIVTTSYTDLRTLNQARTAGVDSFWFKEYSDIELLEVMDITMSGGSWYPEEMPRIAIGNTTLSKLTPAQLEVFYLLPDHFGNAAIAELLHVTENAVKKHIRELLRKTGCECRAQLISIATQSKLVIPKPKNLKLTDE